MKIFKLIIKYFHFILLFKEGCDLQEKYVNYSETKESLIKARPGINKRISKLKEQLAASKTYKENYENSKESLKELNKQIEEAKRKLPSQIIDTDILDNFSKQANYIHIKDVFLKPLKEIKNDFYYVKDYQINGSGTFLQLMVFFERLGNSSRIFNIRNFSIVNSDVKQRGRFKILQMQSVVQTYRYIESEVSELDLDELEKEVPKK